MALKIAHISDVHEKWHKLEIPEVDILISTGDYSFRGSKEVVREFHKWLNKQEAGYIISVNGNHELWVEKNFEQAKEIAEKECPGVYFIGDGQTINIEGIKIFGSACSPWFMDWAWNRGRTIIQAAHHRVPFIGDEWDKIEPGTNIIAVHSPPYDVLDELVFADGTPKGEFVGCQLLRNKIEEIKPDLVLFGHIHAQGGKEHHENGISYFNSTICDEMYYPSNPVRIIDYIKEKK